MAMKKTGKDKKTVIHKAPAAKSKGSPGKKPKSAERIKKPTEVIPPCKSQPTISKSSKRSARDTFEDMRARGRSLAQIKALGLAREDKELQGLAEEVLAGKDLVPYEPPKQEESPDKRTFTITTAKGDEIRIEYNPDFQHHMVYHGPVSPTNFCSDFTFDGKGSPEEYARKKADELQEKLAKELAKKAKADKRAGAKADAATASAPKPSSLKSSAGFNESSPESSSVATGHKLSCLDAAAKVLQDAGAPMTCAEMIASAEAKQLWTSPGGKTPTNTLAAAILRELRAKVGASRFRKTGRGQFSASAVIA